MFKRLLAGVISVILMLSFAGCGSQFENKEEMWEYLNGVWESDNEGNYFIFTDNKFIEINDVSIGYSIEEFFSDYIENKGYEAFKTLTAADSSTDVMVKIKDYEVDDCLFDFEAGKIFDGDPYERIIKINKELQNTITVIDDDDEVTYTKISDSFNLNSEQFLTLFNETKENYKIDVKKFKISLQEYYEKLKENHSEIDSYILINDSENNKMYSDTGSLTNFNSFLSISDKIVLFSKKYNDSKYIVTYNEDCTTVTDSSGIVSFDVMLDDALCFLKDCPVALTAQQLRENFENEAELRYGKRVYERRIDGIHYLVTSRDGTRMVMVNFVKD